MGAFLSRVPRIARKLVPFSGGLLAGISLFWLVPEVAERSGWGVSAVWLVAGFGTVWLVNRYISPVCPSCSPGHAHASCAQALHGFAAPLITASALHSFLDGWALGTSAGQRDLAWIFLIAIATHKLPEGLALGSMLRASLRSPARVAAGILIAQSMTLAGGAAAVALRLNPGAWMPALALAGGTFIYLGYHALEAETRQCGRAQALVPGLAGGVAAAALRWMAAGV